MPLDQRGRGWTLLVALVALVFATVAAGCAAVPPVVSPADPAPRLTEDPARITLEQRHTHAVRGFGTDLILRIRDITGGQTLLTVYGSASGRIVDPVSVRLGDVVSFSYGEDRYHIQLVELKNFLFGGDFAVFTIGTAEPSPIETERTPQEQPTSVPG